MRGHPHRPVHWLCLVENDVNRRQSTPIDQKELWSDASSYPGLTLLLRYSIRASADQSLVIFVSLVLMTLSISKSVTIAVIEDSLHVLQRAGTRSELCFDFGASQINCSAKAISNQPELKCVSLFLICFVRAETLHVLLIVKPVVYGAGAKFNKATETRKQ